MSPADLVVTYESQVMLVDFGIAKAMDSNAGTRIGTFERKAAYSAPEQAIGEGATGGRHPLGWRHPLGAHHRAPDVARPHSARDTQEGRRGGSAFPQEREFTRSRGSGAHPHEGALGPQGGRHPTASILAAELEEFARSRVAPVSEREIGKAVAEAFTHRRERIRGILRKQLSRS